MENPQKTAKNAMNHFGALCVKPKQFATCKEIEVQESKILHVSSLFRKS